MVKKISTALWARLILFSSLIVIIAVTVMGLLFTFFLNRRFDDYLFQENSDVRSELVQNFTRYMAASPTVDRQWLEQFSNVYMEQGMFISVNTPEGELMWNCMDDNNSTCSQHMMENDLDAADMENLNRETFEIPLGDSGESTMLSISYIPPGVYSANDRFFLTETYKMLLLSIIITLGLATLLSVLLSATISRPLKKLTGYAIRLAGHDYSAAEESGGSIREIAALHDAIGNLAFSLESQEKLRKRLTADVSHELRTPLASLQSSLEAMIDGIWPADAQRLESCRSEILRLTELVKNLDNLNAYDNPVGDLKKEKFRLKRSLKSATALFEKDMAVKDISLNVDCPDIVLSGDGSRLKQVWINLLSNALKFTPKGGSISIRAWAEDSVLLTFSDSGTGIDREDLPHIFERFYKTDSSRNDGGSGLGLSIVKEIVELHGGKVRAESHSGLGTQIILEIPLQD